MGRSNGSAEYYDVRLDSLSGALSGPFTLGCGSNAAYAANRFKKSSNYRRRRSLDRVGKQLNLSGRSRYLIEVT
jgi:hypothetical protein